MLVWESGEAHLTHGLDINLGDMVANVNVYDDGRIVEVRAYGGTRRERGSAIAAAIRGLGYSLISIHYSESYGFQSATYARYRRKL